MHGGEVSISSDGVGRGTTVEIRLPLVRQAEAAAPPTSASSVLPLQILLVDDNLDAAQALAMVLELDGHRVEFVQSSAEALDRLLRSPPDVALLDIGMPGMDGYELARRVRRSPSGRSMRLIALTGYGQAEDRQRAFEAGFDDHLVKPIEYEKLMKTLATAERRPSKVH